MIPRDVLLRMTTQDAVVGAGQVIDPGVDLDGAIDSGVRAIRGRRPIVATRSIPATPREGVVCLCEDVFVEDLRRSRAEGFDSVELMKRYSTLSMGPCQGAQCSVYLSCFAEPGPAGGALRPTARSPARAVSLETLAGSDPQSIARRTALHETHIAAGASIGPSGAWERPFNYGDPSAEYRAVREHAGMMDVSTLAKFVVVGPDAERYLDHLLPTRVPASPNRARYVVLLDEAGYVADDGMLIRRPGDTFYLTTTTGGADRTASWLRFVADRQGVDADVVEMTASISAILVSGPRAWQIVLGLAQDPKINHLGFLRAAQLVIAGVACDVVRVGFVGEPSFELHHDRADSKRLWDSLADAGGRVGLRPHGLDTLDVLRLEKGHPYIGQDTLPDDTPRKLGLGSIVARDKDDFVGRSGLLRIDALPLGRRLTGLTFRGNADPRALQGQPIENGEGFVGRITSCEFSPVLGSTIALGWVNAGAEEQELHAGPIGVKIASTPFFDPDGERARA